MKGCPLGLTDEQLQRVKKKSREQLLRPKGMDNKSVESLLWLLKNHIKHLSADPEVKSVLHLSHLSLFDLYKI